MYISILSARIASMNGRISAIGKREMSPGKVSRKSRVRLGTHPEQQGQPATATQYTDADIEYFAALGEVAEVNATERH